MALAAQEANKLAQGITIPVANDGNGTHISELPDDYWQHHIQEQRAHASVSIPEDASNTNLTPEQKALLHSLPPDVEQYLYLMLRKDPSLARFLTNESGKVEQITHAVRAGREKGNKLIDERLVQVTPPELSDPTIAAFSKQAIRDKARRDVIANVKTVDKNTLNFPGVDTEFLPLAHGALDISLQMEDHHIYAGTPDDDSEGGEENRLFKHHFPMTGRGR